MKKVPTLFLRDPADRRFVIPVVREDCAWVLAGEGRPTRQYDGTCVLFAPAMEADDVGIPEAGARELQGWWVRRKVKPGQDFPHAYVIADIDPVTQKVVGWEPADQSPLARWLAEAIRNLTDGPQEGTHELIGPKINRDPEKVGKHVVIAHADADLLDAPRDFEGLARWLHSHPYEGIVWQHPDGRMAKLKRRDVRR